MVGDHEVAGAIPAIQTILFTPPFRGTGHDSAKIVGRGSTPLGGTTRCTHPLARTLHAKAFPRTEGFLDKEDPRGPLTRMCARESCVTVWDETGLQNRSCSVRFAGGVLIVRAFGLGPPCGVKAAGSNPA